LQKHPDLLGAFILKNAMLQDIAYRPFAAQQTLIAEFDMNVIASIEQGKLPPVPQINFASSPINNEWDPSSTVIA